MPSQISAVLSAFTLLLTGSIAGFFYAYSVSVMPGLDLAEPTAAIRAMQGINIAVRNPVFFVTFFLTPIVAVAAAGALALAGQRMAAFLFLGAAAVYFFGAFLPTAMVNVPMNEALAVVAIPTDADAARTLWTDYSSKWTLWNTIRTVFSTLSLLLVGAALFVWRYPARG